MSTAAAAEEPLEGTEQTPAPIPGTPKSAKTTEDVMLRHLWRHYASQTWFPIPQVTVSMHDLDPVALASLTDPTAFDATRDRRIDMLVLRKSRTPARTGYIETMAIEVKVTRADFLSDIKAPEKQGPWRSAATRHTYAVPAGLVQPHEVPVGSGLLWVTERPGLMAEVKWVKRAPYIPGHKPHLPPRVWIALMARYSYSEAQLRGWSFGGAPRGETIEDARAAAKAAQREARKAEERAARALEQAEAWKRAYAIAAADGVPCAHCAAPLKPVFPKGEWFREWRHVDTAAATACKAAHDTSQEAAAKTQLAAATPADLEARLRMVHRFGFNTAIDAEPWRAFLDHTDHYRVYPAALAPTNGDTR